MEAGQEAVPLRPLSDAADETIGINGMDHGGDPEAPELLGVLDIDDCASVVIGHVDVPQSQPQCKRRKHGQVMGLKVDSSGNVNSHCAAASSRGPDNLAGVLSLNKEAVKRVVACVENWCPEARGGIVE